MKAAEPTSSVHPRANCQAGMVVTPQRMATVRNAVVGKSVIATISGLSGLVKTKMNAKNGARNSRLTIPAICWPCCSSVTMLPNVIMMPATSA